MFFRALPVKPRRIIRGHTFQVHAPLFVGPSITPPPAPVVTAISSTFAPKAPAQFRRAGYRIAAPAVVAIPQFPLQTPAANLTLSVPAPAPTVRIAPPPAILRQFVRTNLLPNSGFETDTSGWNDFNGAAITLDTIAHSGDQSGIITETAAGQVAAIILSDPIPALPGEKLSVSGWVRGGVADKAQLLFFTYTAADASINSILGGNGSKNLTPGTWTQIDSSAITMPANTDHVRIGLLFAMQSSAVLATGVGLGQWDDLQLEYGPVVTTLIPTDGGIASGHGITIAIPVAPGILNLSAPVPGLSQDVVVAVPAAVLNLSAPLSSPTFAFPAPPGLLSLSAPSPGILTLSAIPPVPAGNLVLSMPVPCLKRTLGTSIVTPGVLALEPLLPADTCA